MSEWIIDTKEDPNSGDLIIQFPTEMLFFLDWRAGDRLDYEVQDHSVKVRNLDADFREKMREKD